MRFSVDKVVDFIVDWLEQYSEKAGIHRFVVGVSGGIDSAVTATLCAKTGKAVYLINMPIHQQVSQVDRANLHIERLCKMYDNVSAVTTDLTSVFDTFCKQMPLIDDQDLTDLTAANTRARLRMTTLYYLAGIYGCLVVGTGNKIEDFGVGFFTKYGDGGVDLSPIADLVKSEVFALGRFLKVPKAILMAPPTDGLFGDDRTDEIQIGASYDELEWAMQQFDKGQTATDFTDRKREVMLIYHRLNIKNQHKMNSIPVCHIPKNIRY